MKLTKDILRIVLIVFSAASIVLFFLPFATVTAGSETSYIFVKIENGLAGIEAASTAETKNIQDQLTANGWVALEGHNGVYYFSNEGANKVTATEQVDIKVFEKFTVKSDVSDLSGYSEKTIVITAYAVQAAGFANPKTAFETAFPSNTNP